MEVVAVERGLMVVNLTEERQDQPQVDEYDDNLPCWNWAKQKQAKEQDQVQGPNRGDYQIQNTAPCVLSIF